MIAIDAKHAFQKQSAFVQNFGSQRLPASTEHDPTLISALRHASP